ncbi:pectin acetylesterase 5-like [Magnolia sinica]|uniref:pectin acetylesterase 5-like n=1 Tax=Magnolia sinica TaxID=86752 RepID=UPI0026599276|nr:pectin acetylesterase 5-like [Magnolia sinica]
MFSSLQIRRPPSSLPNPPLRSIFSLVWWRRSGKEFAIAAAGVVILVFIVRSTFDSWQEGSGSTRPMGSDSDLVELTLVRNAKARGAVCLDGSSPAYHLRKGFGSGSDSWLVHIEGGGWCNTVASCAWRKMTPLGSSDRMDQVPFIGMFSSDQSQNPDFFNWNKVKIRYCDGASLSGNVESEVQNGTKIFFRGQRIWDAIMDELLSIGLANARQAFLSGCSAGGLATLIHCDDFQARLPKSAAVKCLADAGFFLDEKDIAGKSTMQSFYSDVVHLQGAKKSLNKDCISQMEPSQCFFPQQIVKNIKTPLFIVNSAYDFWQIKNILVPESSDPNHDWVTCKQNIHGCNSKQIEILQGFRIALLNALSGLEHSKDAGMFINSCFIHCQTWMANTWHSLDSPRIKNKTIADTVGNWFFNRRVEKEIDCPYPCNPTCFKMVFD